jgi:acyl-CoA reductase-like NAD-dependent aldehyde dehydrogenase
LIGAGWVSPPSTYPLTSPSTGQVIAHVADCGVLEAREALEATVTAFESWRNTTAYERSALMKKWFALILRDEQEIARMIALEMGKPVSEFVIYSLR